MYYPDCNFIGIVVGMVGGGAEKGHRMSRRRRVTVHDGIPLLGAGERVGVACRLKRLYEAAAANKNGVVGGWVGAVISHDAAFPADCT